MISQFFLFLVLIIDFSHVESFVGRSNRVQATIAFKHSALLMSKESQEKAEEKKRKQAMLRISQSGSEVGQGNVTTYVTTDLDNLITKSHDELICVIINLRIANQ